MLMFIQGVSPEGCFECGRGGPSFFLGSVIKHLSTRSSSPLTQTEMKLMKSWSLIRDSVFTFLPGRWKSEFKWIKKKKKKDPLLLGCPNRFLPLRPQSTGPPAWYAAPKGFHCSKCPGKQPFTEDLTEAHVTYSHNQHSCQWEHLWVKPAHLAPAGSVSRLYGHARRSCWASCLLTPSVTHM